MTESEKEEMKKKKVICLLLSKKSYRSEPRANLVVKLYLKNRMLDHHPHYFESRVHNLCPHDAKLLPVESTNSVVARIGRVRATISIGMSRQTLQRTGDTQRG